MKRCPECRRDYYDDSLRYCLDDGSVLVEGPASTDEPATVILPDEADTRVQADPAAIPKPSGPGPRHIIGSPLILALALGALILTVGLFGYRYLSPTRNRQINSIAVMPFVNDSGNADNDYLSDGMTETLIKSLSALPNLAVKARATVFRYRGKEIEPQMIGRELNVQAILNGRLVQHGEQLILSLELIDTQNENVIWSDRYERTQAELISLQNEIARDVSSKLKMRLSGVEQQRLAKNYTENAEAYRLYLKGRYFWDKRTKDGIDNAIRNYNEAIKLDPVYALAYAGLADCYLFSNTGEAPQVTIPQSKAFATKALELDDTLAEAQTTLSFIKMRYDYDWAGAENGFKRSIELNPNYSVTHQFYGTLLVNTGRIDDGLREINHAIELDPLSLTINWSLGLNLYHARRYDEAITQFQKILVMDPAHELTLISLAAVYSSKGMYAEAIATLQRLDALMKDPSQRQSQYDLAYVYALSSRHAEARQMLDRSKDTSERQFETSLGLAKVHMALGERNEAFELLDKAYENRDFGMIFLKVDPALDPLRDDPRFKELLQKVGLD